MPLPDVDHSYPDNGIKISWNETPRIDLQIQDRVGGVYSYPDITEGTLYLSGKINTSDPNTDELFLLSNLTPSSGITIDDSTHGMSHADLPNFYSGLQLAETNLYLKAWWVDGVGLIHVYWTEKWTIEP